MTSQRWSRLVSVMAFALVMATAVSVRAQWGFPGISGSPEFGLGYGPVQGITPFGYGSCGAGGCAGPSNFIGFPAPGYAQSLGQVPLTTTSFQSVAGPMTLLPGWSGSGYGAHRRQRPRPSVPRVANRQ